MYNSFMYPTKYCRGKQAGNNVFCMLQGRYQATKLHTSWSQLHYKLHPEFKTRNGKITGQMNKTLTNVWPFTKLSGHFIFFMDLVVVYQMLVHCYFEQSLPSTSSSLTSMYLYSRLQPLSFIPLGFCNFVLDNSQSLSISVVFPDVMLPIVQNVTKMESTSAVWLT